MLRLLILEPEGYSQEAIDILRDFSDIDYGPLSRGELKKAISRYDGLIVRLGHKIDREILDNAINLKFIASATTGLNHIDCDYAKKLGIAILSLKGETDFLDSIHATAEHTWALILSLIRNIPVSMRNVYEGRWDRDAFKGSELFGKTLGVIGYGRLGKKIARYAKAFGMNVIVNDVKRVHPDEGITFASLDTLLEDSDIVTIHVPYTRANHNLISIEQINKIKQGAYLVNTSRGEVLDEHALLESLVSGHLAGAALDVMCGENEKDPRWMRSDPLIAYAREHTNLIITPHLGGCTFESMEKTEIFIARKIRSFLDRKRT